jgi:uncharacterized protein YqjF (DUF2071 family)
MAQTWHDLLFAHWPVPPTALRPLVPEALPLDLWEGQAWLGVVPFRMTGIRFRWLPPIPGTSAFAELNVRTYVVLDGRPGVWFFSLDAASALAVAGARFAYHLPYWRARMAVTAEADGVHYESRRTHRGAARAAFRGSYRPTGPVRLARPGSLDHWLTERYCLYVLDPRGVVRRGNVEHAPWPLQPAAASIEVNTMAEPLGLRLEGPPLLHFARELEVRVWPLSSRMA